MYYIRPPLKICTNFDMFVRNYTLQVGRLENALGWYHSHPGYGCWLSGIDVSTQMLNQQFQEPWVAIVVSILQYLNNKCYILCIGSKF